MQVPVPIRLGLAAKRGTERAQSAELNYIIMPLSPLLHGRHIFNTAVTY